MKKEITLDEQEVKQAIVDFVVRNFKEEVTKINFYTSVRGGYDRGDAEEYVKEVVCEVK